MPKNVQGTNRTMATPSSRPKKKYKLTRVDSNRGANEGAPPVSQMPTVSLFPVDAAHHGHHEPFHAGNVRRWGAWRGMTGIHRSGR